ncbi:MAG: hypothetical protein ACXW1U_20935 [Methylobacter sp.]
MNNENSPFKTAKKFFYILFMVFITGCFITGCEQTNQPKLAARQVVKKYDKATTLEGSVSTNSGLVKTGSIKVTDNKDQLVAVANVQSNGRYQVEIPANTLLPIVLTYYSESAKTDAETLITAIVDPAITKYDLNPLTTAIAKKAQTLGGYTRSNMIQAAESTVSVPDANKTSTGFRGDPTTQYGGWH